MTLAPRRAASRACSSCFATMDSVSPVQVAWTRAARTTLAMSCSFDGTSERLRACTPTVEGKAPAGKDARPLDQVNWVRCAASTSVHGLLYVDVTVLIPRPPHDPAGRYRLGQAVNPA